MFREKKVFKVVAVDAVEVKLVHYLVDNKKKQALAWVTAKNDVIITTPFDELRKDRGVGLFMAQPTVKEQILQILNRVPRLPEEIIPKRSEEVIPNDSIVPGKEDEQL